MRSPIITLTLLSLLNAGFKAVHAQEYSLLKDYSGKTFFDDWTFISKFDDLMNGMSYSVGAIREFVETLHQATPLSSTERRLLRKSWPM